MKRTDFKAKPATCRQCGSEYWRPQSRLGKFCSPECFHASGGSSRGPQHQRQGKPRSCVVCGTEFYKRPSNPAKYCSRACYFAARDPRANADALRKQMQNRSGRKNPNWRHGRREGEHSREGAARFRDIELVCRHPDCPSAETRNAMAQHHVVYRQEVRRRHGDVWDPRNALLLCSRCHMSHHRRGTLVVPLGALRDENFEYAADLMGAPAAYEYLRRRYVGEDPRLDALLDRQFGAREGAA